MPVSRCTSFYMSPVIAHSRVIPRCQFNERRGKRQFLAKGGHFFVFTGIFFRKALIAGGGSVSKCHLTDFAPHECYYVRATLLGDISSTSSLSLWICFGAFLAACGGATYLPYAEALFKQKVVGSSEAEVRKHTVRTCEIYKSRLLFLPFLRSRSTFATLARRPSSVAASTWRTPLAGRTLTDAPQGTTPWPT